MLSERAGQPVGLIEGTLEQAPEAGMILLFARDLNDALDHASAERRARTLLVGLSALGDRPYLARWGLLGAIESSAILFALRAPRRPYGRAFFLRRDLCEKVPGVRMRGDSGLHASISTPAYQDLSSLLVALNLLVQGAPPLEPNAPPPLLPSLSARASAAGP
jgi:hypothetical protein